MKISQELVTPEKAARLLENNCNNRTIREAKVEQMRVALLRGEWVLSHQGIAISRDGRLLDGQHRLSAIVAANVAVEMVVARDVLDEAFEVIDRGARRSLADVLKEDKVLLEMASLVAQCHNQRSTVGLTDRAISNALNAFREELTEVRLAVPRASKRASAPIRVGAALRICMGTPSSYVGKLLSDFVGIKDGLPPIALSLWRQMDRGDVSARGDRWDLLARSLIMFDPTKRTATRMQIKDTTAALRAANEVIGKRLERAAR